MLLSVEIVIAARWWPRCKVLFYFARPFCRLCIFLWGTLYPNTCCLQFSADASRSLRAHPHLSIKSVLTVLVSRMPLASSFLHNSALLALWDSLGEKRKYSWGRSFAVMRKSMGSGRKALFKTLFY